MAKRDLEILPPPTTFLVLEEVAIRWRRQPLTTERLLKKFGVPVYRLTAKAHLYKVTDIEAIEEAAKLKPPIAPKTVWKPGQINKTTANTKAGKEVAP
jgi:hypothetical protein